jgi:hypothetical protein
MLSIKAVCMRHSLAADTNPYNAGAGCAMSRLDFDCQAFAALTSFSPKESPAEEFGACGSMCAGGGADTCCCSQQGTGQQHAPAGHGVFLLQQLVGSASTGLHYFC